MNFKKAITIFQIVALVLALILSLFFWVGTSIASGLSRVDYGMNLPYYYLWIAGFIILGLFAKLIFRNNRFILPTIGLISFVALIILGTIIRTKSHFVGISIYDILLFLLPVGSVLSFSYKGMTK